MARKPAGWDRWSVNQRKAHEAKVQARRERREARRADELAAYKASEPGEGGADFEELLKTEQARQEGLKKAALAAMGRKGGAQAPKTITMARENLTEAFDFLGGVAALVVWGRQNRTEFYRIWARLIPKEAAPENETMPLEQLLKMLADRSNQPVAQAALEIGARALEEGRAGALAEDAEAALLPQPDKIVLN